MKTLTDIFYTRDHSLNILQALLCEKAVHEGERRIFILHDENSGRECLPEIMKFIPSECQVIPFCIRSGEDEKEMKTALSFIALLTEHYATRNSLIVNAGGGVICDLGGFAASIYKRGIRYLNIPTTLLSQVDAAVGGKTAVNFNGIKNHIGTFRLPSAVLIHPGFLRTLPGEQWLSGMGELFKYALTGSGITMEEIDLLKPEEEEKVRGVVEKSIRFKTAVTEKDPYDTGLRMILNFGHTIGHGLESASLETGRGVTHGEAVAAGIVAESLISSELGIVERSTFTFIKDFYIRNFDTAWLKSLQPDRILHFILQDKKADQEGIRMMLPDSHGTPNLQKGVPISHFSEGIEFLQSEL